MELNIGEVAFATRNVRTAIHNLLSGVKDGAVAVELVALVRGVEDTADDIERASSILLTIASVVVAIQAGSNYALYYEALSNEISCRLQQMDLAVADRMHAEIYDYMVRMSDPSYEHWQRPLPLPKEPGTGSRPLPLEGPPPEVPATGGRPIPLGGFEAEELQRPIPEGGFQHAQPPRDPGPLAESPEDRLRRQHQLYHDRQQDVLLQPQHPHVAEPQRGQGQGQGQGHAEIQHGQGQGQGQGEVHAELPRVKQHEGQPHDSPPPAPPNPADIVGSYVGGLINDRNFFFSGNARLPVRLPEEKPMTSPLTDFIKPLHNYAKEWFETFARCQWIVSKQNARPIGRNTKEELKLFLYLGGQFEDFVIAIERLQAALEMLESDLKAIAASPARVDFALAQFTEIKRNQRQNIVKKLRELWRAVPGVKPFISALSRAYEVPEDALKYIMDSAAGLEPLGSTLSREWADKALVPLRTYVFLKTTKEKRIRAVTCDAVNQWCPWASSLPDRWFACAQRGLFTIAHPDFPAQLFNVIPVPSRLQLYHGSRTLPRFKVPTGRSWFGGFRVALMYVGVNFGEELYHGSHKDIHAFQTVRELNVVRLMDVHNNAVMDAHLRRIGSRYTMKHLTGFQPGERRRLKRTSYLEIDRKVFGLLCTYWAEFGIHGYADDYAQDQGLHPEMMLCDPKDLIVPIYLPSWPPAPLKRLSIKPLYYKFQPLERP